MVCPKCGCKEEIYETNWVITEDQDTPNRQANVIYCANEECNEVLGVVDVEVSA